MKKTYIDKDGKEIKAIEFTLENWEEIIKILKDYSYDCGAKDEYFIEMFGGLFIKANKETPMEMLHLSDYLVLEKGHLTIIKKYEFERKYKEQKREIILDKIYKYFLGQKYKTLYFAEQVETKQELIIYQDLETLKIFAKQLDMFLSEVDKEKYPNVVQKYEFELIN